MRLARSLAAVVLAAGFAPQVSGAQAAATEASRGVSGGIQVPGWTGKADSSETAKFGLTTDSASFASMAGGFHVKTGPIAAFWNPANKASGSYTVKATFNEPKFMERAPHPHPYGIMVGGNDLGTPQASYIYCAAYGDGTFIFRGFGPAAFQMNPPGRRGAAPPEANPAVHKAAAVGQPVTQEIAVSVRPDKVECTINGTTVASYPIALVVAAGKLKTTDGVYGLRFSHNTEAMVTGLTLTKN